MMKEKRKSESNRLFKRCMLVLLGMLPFMVLGSFYDYEITYFLSGIQMVDGVLVYRERMLSLIIEVLSEWPTLILFTITAYIVAENIKWKCPKKLIFCVIWLGALVIGTLPIARGVMLTLQDLQIVEREHNSILQYILFLSSGLVGAIPIYCLTDKIDKKKILKLGKESVLIVISACILFGIGFLLKDLFGRMRMQDIVKLNEPTLYRNWYELVPFSGYHSFPSGHAAKAGIMYLFQFWFDGEHNKKKRLIIKVSVTLWTILVCVNRLFSAAHYLTDIIVGFGLVLMMVFGFFELRQAIERRTSV